MAGVGDNPGVDIGQFKAIVEHAQDVIVVTEAEPLDEPGPRIVYVNPAFTRLTGYRPEEVIGRSPRFLQHPPSVDPDTLRAIRVGLEHGKGFHGPILNFGKDGRSYWLDMHIFPLVDADGRVTHFAAIERDVTARTLREMELSSAANTDALTGLFNRRALLHMITAAWQAEEQNAVLLLDLDRFKSVNDTHGHAVGDGVLQAMGDVLLRSVRDRDYPVRVGGDEFLLVLLATGQADAEHVGRRMQEEFEHALMVRSLPACTVSIGVACGLGTLDELTASADRALLRAKELGRNQVLSA